MIKILICAHPDDEILWFNPISFDKIYIVFLGRVGGVRDKEIEEGRLLILEQHPFRDKIVYFKITESNFWKDKSKLKEYKEGYDILSRKLKTVIEREAIFYTHNPWGEYGHADHCLVNQAVVEIAKIYKIPVYCFNGIDKLDDVKTLIEITDLINFKSIKNLYLKYNAWTYARDYIPNYYRQYFKIN